MLNLDSLPIRALLRDQRGSIVTLFAMAATVLFAVTALAVDGGRLYVFRSKLQGTADAAALAAARELPDESAARTKAVEYATKNMPLAKHGNTLADSDIEVGYWDPSLRTFAPAGSPANAVMVTTRRSGGNGNPVPTFFAGLMGYGEVDVASAAVARAGSPPICILALEPDDPSSFDVGNGAVTANGCAVHVNSEDVEGMDGGPNGTVTAESICVAGGYEGQPSYTPDPETGCPQVDDPLADLDPPFVGACDETNYKLTSGNDSIDPGVYCGGIDVKGNGTLTLNPGIYVIKNGPLTLAGNAVLIGNGVSFFLTGAGTSFDVTGGGAVTLSAPTTGPMAGILLFADRDLPAGTELAFKGGGNIHYEGTIYAPTVDVRFAGNGSGASPSPYTVFIARTFRWNGNGELSINANYGASGVPLPAGIISIPPRLVM